uniref:UmuC domain-containing protein n=1 Tax=Gouania willdenowi TaxID=441366 RepID=A0A8C5GQD0_GOUWI
MKIEIKNNLKIKLFEKTNFLKINSLIFKDKIDFITCDVSFISSFKILEKILKLFINYFQMILLIKPQYETNNLKFFWNLIMKNNFLLIDMDNFFPSCEVLARKIDNNVPIIVGGYFTKSVVSSCNEVAKSMGVKSAMPYFKVKEICPNAVYIPPNFALYEKMGKAIEQILSKTKKIYEENQLAQFIKTKIYQTLGLKKS